MAYTVTLHGKAEKILDTLPRSSKQRVLDKLHGLKVNPRPIHCEKLTDVKPDAWRVRVGDYRIIYTFDLKQNRIHLLAIGHRREIYRSL